MGVFKKKPDPISEREKALNAEIEALEAKIKNLNERVDYAKSHPKVRSTTLPHQAPAAPHVPVFEEVDHARKNPAEEAGGPEHYNDLGVRKYDLIAAWKRLQNHFRPPPANNPKLVNYLAAGGIKGLRPLRYEKRVARNRFIMLSAFFVIVLWVILSFIVNHH